MVAAALLLAGGCGVVSAQVVELPKEAAGQPGAFVTVPAKTDCASVQWLALDPGLNLFPVELLKDTRTAVVTAPAAGRYRLLAYGAKGDKASPPAVCAVVIGTPPPVPPPPGPGPQPPPPPGPQPDNPLPSPEGLRALIVEEKGQRSELSPGQYDAIMSSAPDSVQTYLRANAVAGPIPGRREWAIYDKDIDVTGEPSEWVKRAFARQRTSTPWLVAAGPGGFYEGPLVDTASTLAVLKRCGGK